MEAARRGAVVWALRKWAVSAFVLAHMGMTALWCLPECPLRVWSFPVTKHYMMPLGLWQCWTMFSPDPVRHAVMLEADVVDSRGLRYGFTFRRLADYSLWGRTFHFRNYKFAYNMAAGEMKTERTMVGHYVVRQLALPAEAFPVDVALVHNIRPTPEPGGPPADPMATGVVRVIDTFHYASLNEVNP
jgi:hypothetical protein